MKSFYEVLGVDSAATLKDIKAAYRKKARQFHPDKNPDGKEQFQEVERAYRVLSDQAARAQYDATGEVPVAYDSDAEAARIVIELFRELLKKRLENAIAADAILGRFGIGNNAKPDPFDGLLGKMQRELKNECLTLDQMIHAMQKGVTQLNAARGRIRRKKAGDDLYAQVLDGKITATAGAMSATARKLIAYEKAIILLDDYEFQPLATHALEKMAEDEL